MYKLVFLALTALICQGQSQKCLSIPTPVQPPSTISPTPLISTTIVDNSVANSLANALQLLIVSHVIDNSINPTVYSSPCLPVLYDASKSIGTVDIVTPAVDIAYNQGPIVDVSATVVTEVIGQSAPNIASTVISEIVPAPIGYTSSIIGVPEVISPGIYSPNIYAPVAEVITPLGTEVITPSVDVFTSITEVVNPFVAVAPPVSPNPYYNVPEVVPPFTQGYITEVTDIVGPREIMNPIPPYYGAYTEVFNPIPSGRPFAAEVVFPQSIPAQLKCNFGHVPTSVPVVNVETVPLVEPGPYPYYY